MVRRTVEDFSNRFGIAGELLAFLWEQRLWWMMPIVVALLLVAGFVALASATGLGAMIYTVF
jgi:hypothetical protein